MGYWGQNLFQSDPDYDIVDELSERTGLKLHSHEKEEGQIKARNAFNDGKFDELFNTIRAEKKKKTLVLLTAIAMQLGANVKSNQRKLIEQIYKKAYLMEGAEKQVEKALKECENGKPWHFKESKGLLATMQDGNDDGFTSPFIIKPGGGGPKQGEPAEKEEKDEPAKNFDEKARENVHKLFNDPNYQQYLASTMEK
jgi:hypothetical protein